MKYLNLKIKQVALSAIAIGLFSTTANAQQWRVISKVKGIDSVVYVYDKLSNRGSSPSGDYVGYDSAIGYSFDAQYLPSKIKEFTTRKYASNGDSVYTESYYFDYNKVAEMDLMRNDSFTYNANGKIATLIKYRRNPYVVIPSQKYQYTYDAQGNLIETYVENYDRFSSVFNPTSRNTYTYDVNNKLLKDSLASYNTSGTLTNATTLFYSYNAQGDVIEIESVYYPGGINPQNNGKHYYYYNAQGQLAGDSIQSVFSQNNIDPQIHSYYYNAQGLIIKDSFYTKYLNIPGPFNFSIRVTESSYTSFGYIDEITLATSDQFGNLVPQHNLKTKYYYERYYPVNIANTQTANQDLMVYPVPTSNMLNIRWDAKQPTQMQARIVNNMGQVVQQWRDKVDGMYTKQILTHNLPNGMYYIVLQADGVEVKKSFVVTR